MRDHFHDARVVQSPYFASLQTLITCRSVSQIMDVVGAGACFIFQPQLAFGDQQTDRAAHTARFRFSRYPRAYSFTQCSVEMCGQLFAECAFARRLRPMTTICFKGDFRLAVDGRLSPMEIPVYRNDE